MRYCRYGLGFIPRLIPVERQQGLLINRSRERCATHRVVITHTHIIEKQKKIECYTEIPLHYVQLVVHSWPRSNIRSIIQFARTSLWCFSRTTDVTVDFHLFTSNSNIRLWPKIICYINGLEAHTKTSGDVRATVETQQLKPLTAQHYTRKKLILEELPNNSETEDMRKIP